MRQNSDGSFTAPDGAVFKISEYLDVRAGLQRSREIGPADFLDGGNMAVIMGVIVDGDSGRLRLKHSAVGRHLLDAPCSCLNERSYASRYGTLRTAIRLLAQTFDIEVPPLDSDVERYEPPGEGFVGGVLLPELEEDHERRMLAASVRQLVAIAEQDKVLWTLALPILIHGARNETLHVELLDADPGTEVRLYGVGRRDA